MKKSLLFLLFVGFQIMSYAQYCSSDSRFTEVDFFSNTQIMTDTGIVYGSALDYQGNIDTLLLDVYYPDTTIDPLEKKPAIVMIHGGSFLFGNKEQRKSECIAFAKRGYVAFSINYRLGWNTLIPTTQVLAIYRAHQDAHAALRYIVNNSSTFNVDTNWIFVGGTSAGAVTSNHLVYTDQNEWSTTVPGIETTLGDLYTSSNTLTDTFSIKGIFNNWGAATSTTMQLNELVPQVAFHGELDSVVEIDSSAQSFIGSRVIHNHLVDNGVCSDLTVNPTGGHGIYTTQIGTVFRASRASCFFKSIFCDNCVNFSATSVVPPSCSVVNGLEEINQNLYKIYPNPVDDQIFIEGLTGSEKFTVFNSLGEVLFQDVTFSNLHLEHLVKGVYTLSIQKHNEKETLRFVKK